MGNRKAEKKERLKNVVGIVYGRDDSEYLKFSLRSLIDQSYPLTKIIYVDDASLDRSIEIATSLNVKVIRLQDRHESWAGSPMLSSLPNRAIDHIYKNRDVDFFLINGADIVLSPDYLEILLDEMKKDNKLVLASGVIEGEEWVPTIPKGAGRLHDFIFWRKHIKKYPFNYSWEAYPIYKARSLGYKTLCTPNVTMRALRKTTRYKVGWGHAMRELGFFPPYAFLRCVLAYLNNADVGYKMLHSYIHSPYEIIDNSVSNWLRLEQCKFIVKLPKFTHKKFLKIATSQSHEKAPYIYNQMWMANNLQFR